MNKAVCTGSAIRFGPLKVEKLDTLSDFRSHKTTQVGGGVVPMQPYVPSRSLLGTLENSAGSGFLVGAKSIPKKIATIKRCIVRENASRHLMGMNVIKLTALHESDRRVEASPPPVATISLSSSVIRTWNERKSTIQHNVNTTFSRMYVFHGRPYYSSGDRHFRLLIID